MHFPRLVRAALLFAAVLAIGPTHAQAPARPIRILVGFAPGGATDLIARLYAQQLKDALGAPVIVENKAGASELMAIRTLMQSPPDGYTLWLAAGSSLTMGPAIRKDLPYEPSRDFTQIGLVATAPGVFFVHPSVPVRTMAELIAYAKENPGKLNYGSAGVGSSSHLQMEYFLKAAGISMTHIPYKAANESVQAVAGGTVHVGLAPAQPVIALAGDGRVRAIAVTSTRRLSAFPNVPTMAEAASGELKSMSGYTFYGLVGPAKLPNDIVTKVNAAINKISAMPEVAEKMRDGFSAEPATSTPASYRAYVDKELAKWREIGKSIKTEAGS
jgi:tripartite-type tricarboxylate transporter receptor subunit TctC